MITLSSTDLQAWLALFLWPFARILSLLAVAPMLGNSVVPARVKIGLAVLMALIVAPGAGPMPRIEPASLEGLLVLSQQVVIGLAIGFAMRFVFSAIEMAGEIAGLQMGLGFAAFFNVQSDGSTLVVAKFLGLLAILLFLALNGHLMMLSVLAESFQTLPVAAEPLSPNGWRTLVDWGSTIFMVGLQLALPVVTALLIVNLALGILTRAAPQLNIFAVGFPITLMLGMVALMLSLPYFAPVIEQLIMGALDAMREIIGEASPVSSPHKRDPI